MSSPFSPKLPFGCKLKIIRIHKYFFTIYLTFFKHIIYIYLTFFSIWLILYPKFITYKFNVIFNDCYKIHKN